jgi:hypothetical protein
MLPLGVRFDEHAIQVRGTVHRTYCPSLPDPLPPDAIRLRGS